MTIRLLVGLGNPGPAYVYTRHNAGAWWVELAANKLGLELSANRSHKGLLAKAQHAGENRWLLLPQTYMNLSGQSVASVAQYYKIPVESILVVHDELDLPPGSTKLKRGGGHAGHNGLKSIQSQLGSSDFWRLRVGIGHPGVRSEVAAWVLQKPPQSQNQAIREAIDQSMVALPQILDGAMDAAIQSINRIKSKPIAPDADGGIGAANS